METMVYEKTIRLGRDKADLARQLECSNVEVWEADLVLSKARHELLNGGSLKNYRAALIKYREQQLKALKLYSEIGELAN